MIALYAAGGGRGHGVRAAALARALEAEGRDAVVIVPSERPCEDLDVRVHRLASARDRESARRAVRHALDALQPDGLVTDAFPNGPAGELASVALPPSVLLARCHRDGRDPRFVEAASRYASVIDLEPHLGWRSPELAADELAPFVREDVDRAGDVDVLFVADRGELAPLFSRIADALSLTYAIAAGGALILDGTRVAAFPSPVLRLCPRVLVGPAGFNLTYEAVKVGAHHLAIARPRRFDDQARRADVVAERISSPRELASRLPRVLERIPSHRTPALADARIVARRVLAALTR